MYSDDTVVVSDVTYTASDFNSASADFWFFGIIYSVYGSFIMYYCYCSKALLDTLGLVRQDGLLQMQQVV